MSVMGRECRASGQSYAERQCALRERDGVSSGVDPQSGPAGREPGTPGRQGVLEYCGHGLEMRGHEGATQLLLQRRLREQKNGGELIEHRHGEDQAESEVGKLAERNLLPSDATPGG